MIKEIIGRKLGMTQVFDADANLVGVSVIEVEGACILEKVEYQKGVKAKIGCVKVPQEKIHKVKKPLLGYFRKIGTSPYKIVKEVDIEDANTLEIKKEVGIEIFSAGDSVDVRAKTKGRGFQGGMKRHGWSGQPRSHGSTTHRRIGSVGASTFPGRIIKGLGMPGHMGNRYITVKNLKVVKVDKGRNVLLVKGAIPGGNKSIVFIKKVKKKVK